MSPTPSSDRDMPAALGVGVLLVICCVLPVLLAAGALGALGGLLDNPWLLAAAGLLALAGLIIWALGRARLRSPTRAAKTNSEGVAPTSSKRSRPR